MACNKLRYSITHYINKLCIVFKLIKFLVNTKQLKYALLIYSNAQRALFFLACLVKLHADYFLSSLSLQQRYQLDLISNSGRGKL